MTDKQINAAIHAALGNPLGCPRCSDPECAYNSGINYCNDLNAMHKAEKVILNKVSKQRCYLKWLGWEDDYMATIITLCHATARQRAEAFLRTLGKWEEGK